MTRSLISVLVEFRSLIITSQINSTHQSHVPVDHMTKLTTKHPVSYADSLCHVPLTGQLAPRPDMWRNPISADRPATGGPWRHQTRWSWRHRWQMAPADCQMRRPHRPRRRTRPDTVTSHERAANGYVIDDVIVDFGGNVAPMTSP